MPLGGYTEVVLVGIGCNCKFDIRCCSICYTAGFPAFAFWCFTMNFATIYTGWSKKLTPFVLYGFYMP